jgi:hypothetical protein
VVRCSSSPSWISCAGAGPHRRAAPFLLVTACQRERPSRCRLACGQSALEAPSSPRRRLRFRCSIERARVHFGRNSSNLDFISVRPVFLRRDDPVRNTEISATVAALRTSQLKTISSTNTRAAYKRAAPNREAAVRGAGGVDDASGGAIVPALLCCVGFLA